ncbi:unnamed protein product [Schistosoma mattheei]|uniref:Uncharacterized protein n=1 Tax=Schistosoma mattheei TaxID=31246 RepID=A0A183PX31_9TREM|nr:unnamed protein product [Schistosoma mattheei]
MSTLNCWHELLQTDVAIVAEVVRICVFVTFIDCSVKVSSIADCLSVID